MDAAANTVTSRLLVTLASALRTAFGVTSPPAWSLDADSIAYDSAGTNPTPREGVRNTISSSALRQTLP